MGEEWTSLRVRQATRDRLREFCKGLKLSPEEKAPLKAVQGRLAVSCDDQLNIVISRLEREMFRKRMYGKHYKNRVHEAQTGEGGEG